MHPAPRVVALPRALLAVPVIAVALAMPAPAAQADNCTVNIQGIVVTDNAGNGQPAACAPQVGRPDGTGTGRKVG